jgi:hypothetical protein
MKKISAVIIGLGLAVTACNKPKEEDCRRAIENIRRISGTDKIIAGVDIDGWVRRCRGNSKRETVACAIGAQTADQLKACGIPLEAPSESPFGGSGAGTASGAGSGTASGSAPK